MSLRLLRSVFVGGFAWVVSACAVEPPDSDVSTEDERAVDEGVGQAEAAIQGGYSDADDKNVVGIIWDGGGNNLFLCTGSLLAPNMVLTARHCVSDLVGEQGGGVSCSTTKGNGTLPVGKFHVVTDEDMFTAYFLKSAYFDVAEVVLLENSLLCGNDQAILILSEGIPDTEAKPLIPRVDTPLVANEVYTAIGYGESSDGNVNSSGYRRRRDNLKVYCAEDECKGPGVSTFVKTSEWIGDTGICSGDSGGPALDSQNRVVGVTSRGGANCTNPIYGSVHSWGDWVKATALHAAEVGGYEPALWAQGWPTDAGWQGPVGGNCQENACTTCWDDECTRLCNSDFGCPTDYECKEVQPGTGVCVAKPPPPPSTTGGGDSGDSGDSGCSVQSGADPTNPVPWFTGVAGLALLSLGVRRAKRRSPRS